jgi:hypothetical protein
MITPEPPTPTLWLPETISSNDYEQLERALKEIEKDERINEFVKCLNYTIEDIVRKKRSKAASVGTGQQVADGHPSTAGSVKKHGVSKFHFSLHGVAA